MIEPTPRKIVYYFAEYQLLFERYEDRIEFCHRMPKADTIDWLTDTLVVYDDLMDEADERLTRIFTCGSHHSNVSVIFMVQNFFQQETTHGQKDCNCEIIDCFSECAKNVLNNVALKKGQLDPYWQDSCFHSSSSGSLVNVDHAKLLCVIDEFDPEYKRVQRPSAVVAKVRSAVQLNDTLRSSKLDDHEKAPQYVAELHCYLNISTPPPAVRKHVAARIHHRRRHLHCAEVSCVSRSSSYCVSNSSRPRWRDQRR